jgi:hypothetical protein
MAKDTGFFQLRRGIWEHVRDGRMSLQDVAVHQYIASQADTRTGIWNGSAGALAGELCISPRMARRFIERLTKGDYLRRFPLPGRHSCYPILVHKFLITDGQHKGEQLNALASTSPADLRYFSGEHVGEQKGEHLSSQKRIENRERRKALPDTYRQADGRSQAIVNAYYQRTREMGIEPNCDESDFGRLKSWLKKNPHRSLDGILASLHHAFASTDPYPLKPGFRLREFLEHEAKYQRGPLLRATPKPAQTISLPKNELTPNGERKLAAYGVAR